MSQHCGTSFDHVALMMSPATGSEAQSVAAFMLLRGPHALWGKGWMGDNKVFCEYLCQPNSETETAALLIKQRCRSVQTIRFLVRWIPVSRPADASWSTLPPECLSGAIRR